MLNVMNSGDPIRREFEDLKSGEKSIQSYIDGRAEEILTLDFKNPPLKNLDSINKSYSKTGSAMANTSGGLIIWGVVCQKHDGVDVATEAPGYDQPEILLNQLRNLDGKVTDPPLSGAEHAVVGGKYVATLIPANERRPFQSVHNGSKYYMRAGSNSVAMPHRMVLDAILAKDRPEFELQFLPILTLASSFGREIQVELKILLLNNSSVSAESIFVYPACNSPAKFEIRDYLNVPAFRHNLPRGWNASGTTLPTPNILHPGMSMQIPLTIKATTVRELICTIAIQVVVFCKNSSSVFELCLSHNPSQPVSPELVTILPSSQNYDHKSHDLSDFTPPEDVIFLDIDPEGIPQYFFR